MGGGGTTLIFGQNRLSHLWVSIWCVDPPLLDKLKNSGIGCHIGHIFVGALVYADDLILLCPSVVGLNEIIKKCEEYANEHDILFNGKKRVRILSLDHINKIQ